MTSMKVHDGKIITQTVEKIKETQLVLISFDDKWVLGKIDSINKESIVVINLKESDESFTITCEANDLRRLVVTDGTRFAPLQNEDWKLAVDSNLIDNDSVKYIIIERKISDEKLIRLARIFRPRQKINKMSKEEIQTAFFASLDFCGTHISVSRKEYVFDKFWELVSTD